MVHIDLSELSRDRRMLDLTSEVAARLAWEDRYDGWLEELPAVYDWDTGQRYQGEAALELLRQRQRTLGV